MAHLESELQHTAEVFARVSTLASALGVSAKPLLEACAVFDVEPARFCRVSVPGDLDAVALSCRWPDSEAVRAAIIADLSARDRLQGSRAETLLARESSDCYVDYALMPSGKIATTLHALGLRGQAEDIALLDSFAHVGDAIDRVGSLLAGFGDQSAGLSDRCEPSGHHSWSVHAPLSMRTREDHEQTPERIDTVCEALGVTMPQRLLIRDLHSVLAKNRTALASLRVGPGVTYPELSISYRGLRFESVIRVLQGLSMGTRGGDETGAGVGAIAGAFDSELAHAFELTLRNEEPPRVRISVDLEMGRPCRP